MEEKNYQIMQIITQGKNPKKHVRGKEMELTAEKSY